MGKKTFGALLFTLLFGALMHVSAWAETAIVTGSDVNMREGPGTNFRIVDCLPRGEQVMVTDRSNGSWYCVEHEGVIGFMSASFLNVMEAEVAQPAQSVAVSVAQSAAQSSSQNPYGEGQEGYVSAMYVRFRSAPGAEYSVRGEYNRGKALQYYFTSGDWAACIIDGVPGYIYKDYIALGRFDGYAETPAAQSQASGGNDLSGYYVPAVSTVTEVQEAGPDELSLQHATSEGVEQTPGYINANYVRFRKGPGSSFPIIDSYGMGKAVGVTGSYQDWTACIIDGVFGFVYSDYVTVPEQGYVSAPVEETTTVTTYTPAQTTQTVQVPVPTPATQLAGTEGYVSGNNVRMRSAPSMSASIVDELYYGNALTIVGVTGDWTAVICNGQAGYIYTQFVSQGSLSASVGAGGTQTNTVSAGSLSGSSLQKGQQIAMYAYGLVGCPYSWGGKDPSGFDCSGLVYYVYQQFGITLNRVAQDQARNGTHVDPANLQPGDVLCFYSGSSYIGHSGIYIGYGMFVHAQNSATGVVVTELAGHYSERGFEARRIV